MILLDTNAVLWLLTNHERAKPLLEATPSTLLVTYLTT